MMRCIDELVVGAPGLANIENPASSTLERLQRRYRTQVLVDEATDLSPIQLACMATLARPRTRSFFACGDFSQRVTDWGIRSVDEMRWVVSDVEIKEVFVVYRQSRQLHELAREIVKMSGADTAQVVLPDYAENDGVSPVLATNMNEVPTVADWLAGRIVEIEKIVHPLPSIAVLVNGEEMVHRVATALGGSVMDESIRVIPCSDGRVQGRDSAVRVFDVQHIKGLEFEAVFFVGVDQLAELDPDLFDKYLYVGATRAATYLGITCERELPASMAMLEKLFVDGVEVRLQAPEASALERGDRESVDGRGEKGLRRAHAESRYSDERRGSGRGLTFRRSWVSRRFANPRPRVPGCPQSPGRFSSARGRHTMPP